jgi:hypothetical protein
MTWATVQEALDWLDDSAAEHPLEALSEHPLEALREYANYLSEYRFDACATAEPAAALIHAYHLLTPERRVVCAAAARSVDLKRFIPDRLAQERREALAQAGGQSVSGVVEVLELRRVENAGKKVFAKVRLGCIVIHGCRVVQQPEQKPWVALPQTPARKEADGAGSGCFPVVAITDRNVLDQVRDAVLEAWGRRS